MSGTVNDALVFWSRINPDKVAVDFDGDAVTYRELSSWADGVAAKLAAEGVRAGDRVALLGNNSLEWCAATLGAWRLGAIVAPFNHRMLARELTALVEDCEPTVVYGDAVFAERLGEVHAASPTFVPGVLGDLTALRGADHAPVTAPIADRDDVAAIIFTSGTTGRPKGVIFSHATIAGMTQEWSLIEPVPPNDLRQLLVLPMFTAAGVIWAFARVLINGGTLFLQPAFNPARAVEVAAANRVTTIMGPPIIFQGISGAPGFAEADLSSVVTAHVGGARVPVDLLRAWQAKGVLLRQIYGQTEIGGSATVMPRDLAADNPEKCGRGGIFTKVRVVDPEGTDCPAGTAGEILLRGPAMMPGYWRNKEATEAALKDGWLHTGDMGVLDEEGYLTFVDRIKDMIISGGLNIAPLEIENVLTELPGVQEVSVIGVHDAKFGETPAALIKTTAKLTEAEVIEHCNARLADYKVPRYVVFVEGEFPRMASGKIAKRELRDTYRDVPDTHGKVR
ncbi:fatty-acyl-CoA synthase [Actinocorallia herbida]|uniref:Fatty-acyl-CoA synthase n=1 Tax=Actinocorallia herbida TaxID=58109 RepID=A0A3N1CVI2_9ACTN|nr:AMP-binding protein [Actinocorallia herbida]ROO85303.1 fatty-acyl-CoA synthase [Actinocorallia herbida]